MFPCWSLMLSLCSLICRRRLSQPAFHYRSFETAAPVLNIAPRKPNIVTTARILAEIDAELIVLDPPRARALLAHGPAHHGTVAPECIPPVDIIAQFHSHKVAPDLRAGQIPKFFSSSCEQYA